MKRVPARVLDFFDRHVIKQMMEKYDFDDMHAIKSFIQSETYQMLSDPQLALYEFSPLVIFDMWESEQITGNPRNSLYLRADEVQAETV